MAVGGGGGENVKTCLANFLVESMQELSTKLSHSLRWPRPQLAIGLQWQKLRRRTSLGRDCRAERAEQNIVVLSLLSMYLVSGDKLSKNEAATNSANQIACFRRANLPGMTQDTSLALAPVGAQRAFRYRPALFRACSLALIGR